MNSVQFLFTFFCLFFSSSELDCKSMRCHPARCFAYISEEMPPGRILEMLARTKQQTEGVSFQRSFIHSFLFWFFFTFLLIHTIRRKCANRKTQRSHADLCCHTFCDNFLCFGLFCFGLFFFFANMHIPLSES